jgi:hypothetical protein
MKGHGPRYVDSLGDEYPRAVNVQGMRMPLARESRFLRVYRDDVHGAAMEVSRFMDGTATMTPSVLDAEWTGWDEELQVELCKGLWWVDAEDDREEMLRFVMRRGNPRHWSAVAPSVACYLEDEEAFALLWKAVEDSGGIVSGMVKGLLGLAPETPYSMIMRILDRWLQNPLIWSQEEAGIALANDALKAFGHLRRDPCAMTSGIEKKMRELGKHPSEYIRGQYARMTNDSSALIPKKKVM